MKTIFIAIPRGILARNVLQTDVFNILKKSENKFVIFSTAFEDLKFKEEFGGKNIFFEPLLDRKRTWLENIFFSINRNLIYNTTTEIYNRWGIRNIEETSYFFYILKKIFFVPLSKIHILKNFMRWIDIKLYPDKLYNKVFDKYKPDLLFDTGLVLDLDVHILKHAKQKNIPTIAMFKSWDNLSKFNLRIASDKLIVWGEFNKKEAIEFQNYKADDIVITGAPQFDIYFKQDAFVSREEFCRQIGADPQKKLILFGSAGNLTTFDSDVIEMMLNWIESGKLAGKYQILIRPHIGWKGDKDKFEKFKGLKNVVIDVLHETKGFSDQFDYSVHHMKHLANSLKYSEVVVTAFSALSVDACVMNKPVINIAFDGKEKKPYHASVRRWYDQYHYSNLLQMNAIWLVKSELELQSSLRNIFENSHLKSVERKKLCSYFVNNPDGTSGKKIANYILNFLHTQT